MNVLSLPAGYRRIGGVDLVRDRRAMLAVNLAALLLMALLFVLGIFLVPLSLRFRSGMGALVEGILLLGAVALYMVLHELVHGVLMRRYSGARPRYGFNGLYAYAGSDAYFDKRSYRIIALAPVVLWGLVLFLLNLLLPRSWFWPVYLIQILNLSGAAGDLYVCFLLHRLPADLLVQDTGVAMSFFAAES